MSNVHFLLCVVHGAVIKVYRVQEEDYEKQQQRGGIDVTAFSFFQI